MTNTSRRTCARYASEGSASFVLPSSSVGPRRTRRDPCKADDLAALGYRSRRTSVQPCGFRAGRATSRATDAPPGHDEADFTARREPAPRPTGRAALEERTDGAIRAEVRRLKVSAAQSARMPATMRTAAAARAVAPATAASTAAGTPRARLVPRQSFACSNCEFELNSAPSSMRSSSVAIACLPRRRAYVAGCQGLTYGHG
jgi:hypothetical protein